MIYVYNVQCNKSNHSSNLRIFSFATNKPHIWRRFTYYTWKDFSPLFHHKLEVNIFSCWFSSYKDKDGSEKPDDCALFFNWWCFFTPIYRTKYIIHHSHQVVLHSFRLHSHCLIPFSSYKRTTVCNTSGRRIWGNFSSCLNTIGICRPTFAGFCDTRSTSLQSGPPHLSPDQAEISEPAEPVVPCPALDGFSASLVSGSGTGLH